jgi:hypothetical protein
MAFDDYLCRNKVNFDLKHKAIDLKGDLNAYKLIF